MTRKVSRPFGKLNRRLLLKGAAAGGAAVATEAIGGFPTVWAQNTKDVTLVVAGGSYAVIKEIGEQAGKDLGFKLVMQAITDDFQINRSLTQPNTIDIDNIDSTKVPYLVGKGVLMPIPVAKYKQWADTVPLFTKNAYPNGEQASSQGLSPFNSLFYADKDGKKLANKATDFLTFVPTIYNADTLGIRPDLVGGRDKITSWKDLLDPKYKGKTALVDYAAVGVIDVAMALEARGDFKYGNKGNMTKDEIDKTIKIMIDLKKGGHFRSFWSTFDQSVNLMASGEVVIQSMWSPAVTAVRSRGIDCYYVPLKEGYRGWFVGLAPMAHLSGLKLDCAMQYINWYNSGWQGGFIAKQGYYSAVPATAKKFLTPEEWDYWYEGKPAAVDIKDPYGALMEKKGVTRDGGGIWDRMGNIACWNTVMDEDRYLTRRWNEFVSS
ncbi:MAG: extracellular solute-binding protein [Alphaproteobacteria bacterium]|nr:extracellular solute-binding protein [Alphaproteobacteria bacterium]